MTPYQRKLARHALGLRKGQILSYRNRYTSYPGNADHEPWLDLVRQGLAGHAAPDFFYLTYAGALLALDKGEALDVEDFPELKVVKP